MYAADDVRGRAKHNGIPETSSSSPFTINMSREDAKFTEAAKAVQETDNEALSSLLMLSKSNSDSQTRNGENEHASNMNTYHNRGSDMRQHQPMMAEMKRPLPATERAMRGESNQPLSKSVRMEDLRRFFHLPIVEVARQLGTCTTALKKICRKHQISKWPYRQIRSITKSIQSLEMASLNDTLNEDLRVQYREQIVTLQNAIDELLHDPNKIVTLVNMGLSEDLAKNADRSSSSLMSHGRGHGISGVNGSGSGGSGLGGMHIVSGIGMMSGGIGGGGQNMLPWPKPSDDVQQIMLAASAMTSQSVTEAGVNSSSNKVSRSGGSAKRKLSEGGTASDFIHSGSSGQKKPANGSAVPQSAGMGTQHAVSAEEMRSLQEYNSLLGLGAGIIAVEPSSSAVRNHTTDSDSLDGDDAALLLSGEGGDNLRCKVVEIGLTVVQCDFSAEGRKMQFSGPVQLAPLQRKKLRPNVTRKVVPLMEPDIGSNFAIEFVPQFVLDILHRSVGPARSVAELERRLLGGGHDSSHAVSAMHNLDIAPQQSPLNTATSAIAVPTTSSAAFSSLSAASSATQQQHQQQQQQHYAPQDAQQAAYQSNMSAAGTAPQPQLQEQSVDHLAEQQYRDFAQAAVL